jgi:hypothetical protein
MDSKYATHLFLFNCFISTLFRNTQSSGWALCNLFNNLLAGGAIHIHPGLYSRVKNCWQLSSAARRMPAKFGLPNYHGIFVAMGMFFLLSAIAVCISADADPTFNRF